jgi:DNA-binding transcriptional ArsR family regulator
VARKPKKRGSKARSKQDSLPKIRKRPELEPVEERLMKALSHPMRVQILTLINGRPWSPNELANELDEGLSQVSYHVKVLKDNKCIRLVKTEPRRGAVEHFYEPVTRIIVPEGMSVALPKSARLELLDRIVRDAERDVHDSLKAGTFYQRDDMHADWMPMELDDEGCKELHKREDAFLAEVLEIAGESASRIAEGAKPIPTTVVLFGFVSHREPGEKSTAHRRRG